MDTSEKDLLETFKAAALSVTKLYKTSAAASSKARADGYQECLEDLLSFMERQKLDLDGPVVAIRQWALDRQDGRDGTVPAPDVGILSEDDATGAPPSSPVVSRAEPVEKHGGSSSSSSSSSSIDTDMKAVPSSTGSNDTTALPVMPTRETFTFQSPIPYPTDHPYPNLATLELSDHTNQQPQHHHQQTKVKARIRSDARRLNRSSSLRSLTGQKRKINFDELFDLSSLGKDPFGGIGGKRSRHT